MVTIRIPWYLLNLVSAVCIVLRYLHEILLAAFTTKCGIWSDFHWHSIGIANDWVLPYLYIKTEIYASTYVLVHDHIGGCTENLGRLASGVL